MQLNVLLMLSSAQPPPPGDEIRWHAAECAGGQGFTYLITTVKLTGLAEGKSIVAFYTNADLGNQYLGQGVYLDYIPLQSPRGQDILTSSHLYSAQGIPKNAKGFIQLQGVRMAGHAEQLTSLNGSIKSTGQPLTLANIPRGQARSRVYYHATNSGTGQA